VYELFNVREFWRSMKPVLAKWEPQCLLLGRSCRGGLLQNTSCVLPFGPAKIQLFNFAPGKISWLLFWAVAKKSLAVKGETHSPTPFITLITQSSRESRNKPFPRRLRYHERHVDPSIK
jgi:hypothetical protein